MGFIARCNIKCLQNHDYLTVGQMLATMIVQGGEQPCLFTKSICDYISMGLDASNPGIEEVPGYTIRDNLKKVKYKLVDQFINSSIKFYFVSPFVAYEFLMMSYSRRRKLKRNK